VNNVAMLLERKAWIALCTLGNEHNLMAYMVRRWQLMCAQAEAAAFERMIWEGNKVDPNNNPLGLDCGT